MRTTSATIPRSVYKVFLFAVLVALAATACSQSATVTQVGQADGTATSSEGLTVSAPAVAEETAASTVASDGVPDAALPWGDCSMDSFFLPGLTATDAINAVGADPAAIVEIENGAFTGCTIWGDFDGSDEYVQVYDPTQLNGISFEEQAGPFYDGSNLSDIDGYRAVITPLLTVVDLGDYSIVVASSLDHDQTLPLTRRIIELHPGAGPSTLGRGAPPQVDFDPLDDESVDIFEEVEREATPINPATGLPEWIEGSYPSWVTCDHTSALGVGTAELGAEFGVASVVGEAYENNGMLKCTLGIPIDTSPYYDNLNTDIELVVSVEALGGTSTRSQLDVAAPTTPGVDTISIASTTAYVAPDGFGAMIVVIGGGDSRMLVSASSRAGHSDAELREFALRAATALINAGAIG